MNDAKTQGGASKITIVIPVHNAFRHLERCLLSVLANTDQNQPLLIIDDASTESRIGRFLTDLEAERPSLDVHTNRTNIGYTRSVNLGLERSDPQDVLILNSDTIVSPGWLDKLALTLKENRSAATVTPVSNAAGAFSVPVRGRANPIPTGHTVDSMAELVEKISPRLQPRVPTGNGFCLLIRRAAIDQVGSFDALHFPRGYGEENDFCMRAAHAGFSHFVDDSTYIFHHRGASFGWRRHLLQWRAQQKLRRLHPEYRALVTAWFENDQLEVLRSRLLEELSS